MKHLRNKYTWILAVLLSGYAYMIGCTHDDVILESGTIVRGNDNFTMGQANWKLDKTHSSVLWETLYLGQGGLLTGRFNNFGITSMTFNESDPSGIAFTGWVWLNTVNTGEPGRDAGCLLGTFGTATGKTTEPENIAQIVSKSVALSTTDAGYDVTFDMTFLNKTYTGIKGKLNYIKKSTFTPASGNPYDIFGLRFEFSFQAKTWFGLVSNNVADKVSIRCNMNFNNK